MKGTKFRSDHLTPRLLYMSSTVNRNVNTNGHSHINHMRPTQAQTETQPRPRHNRIQLDHRILLPMVLGLGGPAVINITIMTIRILIVEFCAEWNYSLQVKIWTGGPIRTNCHSLLICP